MLRGKALSFTAAFLLASLPAFALQNYESGRSQERRNNQASQNRRDNPGYGNYGDQQYRRNQNFYNGVREGGRGGDYYDTRHATDGYDERYNQRRGGIGPGKGALIGGAGGAVLGVALGGGLKGSLIGGAAGAGIGAIIGKAAENRRRGSEDGR